MVFVLAMVRLMSQGSAAKYVIATLALASSRALQTVALFLPIKILLLLSGSGAPSILQIVPFDPQFVLGSLMAGVPAFYAAAILLGAWFQRSIDSVNPPPDPVANGIPMPAKQYVRLYEAVVRISADWLVVLFGLVAILIFSWPLALASVIILGLYGLTMEVMIFGTNAHRYTPLKLNEAQFLEYGRTTSFILLFGILAMLVVYFDMNVYLAILSMLIARLMCQSIQRFFSAAFRHRKIYAKWIESGSKGATTVPA